MSDFFMNDDTFCVSEDTELEAIRGMLRVASERGLEAEVVREAMREHELMDCTSIEQACANALVEWDL